MKKFILGSALMAMALAAGTANAATKAYWRFEPVANPTEEQIAEYDGAAVEHLSGTDNHYDPDIPDLSGNGYELSTWNTGGDPGYVYRALTAESKIRSTGEANYFSVQNSGNNPGMFTNSEDDIRTWTPDAFTIELTFKPRNGDHRTFVGRDSYGAEAGTPALAALYVKVNPDQNLAFSFCDVDGNWHSCVSAPNVVEEFIQANDPYGDTIPWYTMTAVSTGEMMYVYLYNHDKPQEGYQLVASTDMSLDAQVDGNGDGVVSTALTAGAGDGGDWDAGNFTVGRGMWDGGHGDRAYGIIDEVRITDGALDVSDFLYGPCPVIESYEITRNSTDFDATIAWTPATRNGVVEAGITEQYILINSTDDPNLVVVAELGDPGTQADFTATLTGLAYDIDYMVSVVNAAAGEESAVVLNETKMSELDPNNMISNMIRFNVPSVPIIITQPVGGTTVDGAFDLSIEVESLTPEHYSWFYSVDDVADGTDGENPDRAVGDDSAEISLSGLDIDADQGFYYCIVSNDGEATTTSNLVYVEVEGLVSHYLFDGDVTDSKSAAGMNNDGKAYLAVADADDTATTMSFETGFEGSALVLNSADEKYVEIPCRARNSYTIAMWVKTTQTAGDGSWWFGAGLVDGEMPGWVADYGTVLSGSGFAMGSGPSGVTIVSEKAINDGTWHYCVATRDKATGTIRVYVDGHMEAEATSTDTAVTYTAIDVLNIGKIRTGTNYFTGAIDDLYIYNYALDQYTIADNYLAYYPDTEICMEDVRPALKYDMNDDCRVDAKDFAEFAQGWMESGLYDGE